MKKFAFLLLFLCSAASAQCLQNPDGSCVGQWISVAYNANDYSAKPGMLWSVPPGGVNMFKYSVVGKTMTVAFYISGTNLSGTASNDLFIQIPGGKLAAGLFVSMLLITNGGVQMAGFGYTVSGGNKITISRIDDAVFVIPGWTYVSGEVTFEFI